MQSLFERTVFRSANGESEYEPHTNTMYFSRPSSNMPLDNIILHEEIHWIQCISYTFGGFQSVLTNMSDTLAKVILTQYDLMRDEYQRHQVRFYMPNSEEAFYNFTFDHEGLFNITFENPEIQNILLHQIHWRDAHICRMLFLKLSSFYEKDSKLASAMSSADEELQPELLIPRTLRFLNNFVVGALYADPATREGTLELPDSSDYPKLRNFGRAFHAGIELDTTDIIEGMAVAFEIYTLREREEEAKQRIKAIANTSYVRALEIFLEIMGFPVRYDNDEEIKKTTLNIARMALMFLAIAEMSLNPPLPPFGIIKKLELDWNKIYPPLRFIKLCHIVKCVVWARGYILDPNPFNWILDWIAYVESWYLSQGGVFSYLPYEKEWHGSSINNAHFLALIAEENATMQDLLRCTGMDFMGKMKELNLIGNKERIFEVLGQCEGLEIYAMLRYLYHWIMSSFGIARPFLIPFEVESWKTGLLKPPLIVFKDGIYTSGWSSALAEFLIQYNLFHYPLHDVILGQEPQFYLPDYPLIDEEKRKSIWSRFQKIFLYTF